MKKIEDKIFEEARQLVFGASSVLLLSHEFTDGDDLGAMSAMRLMLESGGDKKVFSAARGGVPQNLLFLPGVSAVADRLPDDSFDLIIMLGCGSPERHGFPELELGDKKVLNVDHHPDNKLYGVVNLVEPSAAATCEVVYHFIKYCKAPLDKAIATNLLAGLFTDTGGFRHASTSAEVFEIAAELMRKGARIDRISGQFFRNQDLPKLKAWSRALENARFDEEQKMVYSIVTEEELREIGAEPEHLEGIAEILNTIPEANFSMLLKQRGEEIRGSLRSENYKGVDVSAIARTFGGGGHKLAAGFKLKGKIEKTADGWKIT